MKNKLYWGVVFLIILLVGVTAVLRLRDVAPEPITIYKVPPDEQVKKVVLKKPPPGKTYGTGHWEGDTWHRTVPPEPEDVSVDDKMWTYADLKNKMGYPPDRQKAYRLTIEAYPYSELALSARYSLINYDENGKYILHVDNQTKLEKYKEMLQYHPDSPRLFQDLAQLTERDAPEESIFYAKEALKYIDLYPPDTTYGRWTYPEEIHENLGIAYQRVGDYESAFVHFKKAKTLIEANLGRRWETDYLNNVIVGNIEAIESGNPRYRPPSEMDTFEGIDPSLLDPFNLPPVSDFDAEVPSDPDVMLGPRAMPADLVSDPRAVAAEQERAAFEQRQQQEFDEFIRSWMAERERAKSSVDLEDFLMREMAKHLQGESTVFSADRMVRARELLQRHGESEGMLRLEKRDAALAREMARHPRSQPNKSPHLR